MCGLAHTCVAMHICRIRKYFRNNAAYYEYEFMHAQGKEACFKHVFMS